MKKYKQLALAILLLACIGCGGTDAPVEMATRGYNHDLMKEAVEKAKAQLGDFIEALESGSGKDFAIKESVSDGNNREYIWLTDVEYSDGKFEGVVTNASAIVEGIKIGDRRTVPKSKVADWKYENDGKKFGNFTLKILIHSVPENDRAPYNEEPGG